MTIHAAQQIVGLIMVALALAIPPYIGLLTRPWNIRKRSS